MEDLHCETLLRGVIVTLDTDSAEARVLQSPLKRVNGIVIVIVQNGCSLSTMSVDYSGTAVTKAFCPDETDSYEFSIYR